MRNIRAAARAAETHDGMGLLLTDWGDYGHMQVYRLVFDVDDKGMKTSCAFSQKGVLLCQACCYFLNAPYMPP